MQSYLFINARIVSPADGLDFTGSLRVADGNIAAVGQALEPQPGDAILDAGGKVLLPGLVDMHVHLRDPGFTHKEDILTGCEAAAAGGVTTVACMPNTKPVADSVEVIRYILDKAAGAKARVCPVAAITRGLAGEELTDMVSLKAAGAAAVSDDGRPVPSAWMMRAGMERAEGAGLLTISHCEDLDLIHGGIMHLGSVSRELGVLGMDRASEDSVTARELALAESAGTRIHIAHVSTAGAAAFIRAAKARGVRATCETAPHYFLLTHELLRSRDADYRMNPPLREPADLEAMKEAILDGTIDCIATDHAPHSAEEKSRGLRSLNGIVGLECAFPVLYTELVEPGIVPFATLLNALCVNPRRLFRLPGGKIEAGEIADLTVLDLNWPHAIDSSLFFSQGRSTPFDGWTVTAGVDKTICNGNLVYTASSRNINKTPIPPCQEDYL